MSTVTGLLPLREYGAADGVPMVALHCSLAHSGAWSGFALAGSGENWQLIAPDLLGHGEAPEPKGDLHSDTTRAVIRLIEAKSGGQPIDLMGHSFGATVALRVALEAPELIRRLVLIEPVLFSAARAVGGPEFRAYIEDQYAMIRKLQSGDAEGAAADFHAVWGTGAEFARLPEPQRRYFVERIGFIPALDGALLQDNASLLNHGRLESLGLPVLLLRGANSPAVIPVIQAELLRRLPMAEEQVIEGAGHMLPITHPQAVVAAVSDFLARHPD